jgi:SAM-dependent methyltransferase
LILDSGVARSDSIIDVGGGASTLVDDLLRDGYGALTVLDLSAAALAAAQRRLGRRAREVQWVEADITTVALPLHAYDLWHDRAVFHFLTSPEQRAVYVQAVIRAVKPGGHVIVATFAEDGPTQCSGLPVMRYRADDLHAEFGQPFELLKHEKEAHHTPFGTVQKFVYCYCRKASC